MRDKLGLTTRDWIWIGTLIVGWVANYAAVTATVSARLASVERTVERMDSRLWELRAGRASTLTVARGTCPADATRVRVTMNSEVNHGTDR